MGQHLGDRAVGIVHDEHPGQAAVDVPLGLTVRVRVVPQRRRGLVDRPGRLPRLARSNGLVWPAVHLGGQVHAVPVDAGVLVELVGHLHHDLLPTRGAQRRAEIGPLNPTCCSSYRAAARSAPPAQSAGIRGGPRRPPHRGRSGARTSAAGQDGAEVRCDVVEACWTACCAGPRPNIGRLPENTRKLRAEASGLTPRAV